MRVLVLVHVRMRVPVYACVYFLVSVKLCARTWRVVCLYVPVSLCMCACACGACA
jgi:hypothetical protein